MPHRAKAEEAIKRRMTEIQDIVETCNLAPYKMDEFKKELKKLNNCLSSTGSARDLQLSKEWLALPSPVF